MKRPIQLILSILLLLIMGVSVSLYFFYDAAQFKYKWEARQDICVKEYLQQMKVPLKKNFPDVWVTMKCG